MSMRADINATSEQNDEPISAIGVSNTPWGYIIHPADNRLTVASIGEIAAAAVSFAFFLIAFGQWVVKGSLAVPELLPFKIASTVVFAMFACFTYLIARRGLSREFQVDAHRRVVRTARRNRRGGSNEIEKIAFNNIDSVFVEPAKSRFKAARLVVRHANTGKTITAIRGPEEDLGAVLALIRIDLGQSSARDSERRVARPSRNLRTRPIVSA